MPKRHLNAQFIKNLKAPDKRTEYYDQHLIDPDTNTIRRKGVKGLILRVTKAGNKYWYYKYWHSGTSKRHKIGNYPDKGLSEARELARDVADKVNEGIDPNLEKRGRKNTRPPKFKDLAERFKSNHLPNLRTSTQKSYKARINSELLPAFKYMALHNITRVEIVELLEEIANERGEPTNSNRVRAILSSMFNFAVQRGMAEYNPVKTVKPIGKERSRNKTFHGKNQLKALWKAFNLEQEPLSSIFKVLLLTGQRKGETRHMRWSNINKRIWTIPAKHAKSNRVHEVPLSPLVIDIIERLKLTDSEYVFESRINEGKPILSLKGAVKRIRDRTGFNDFRVHDLRGTFASGMASLKISRTVTGKLLNHKTFADDNSVTGRHYDKHNYQDEKRRAMNLWSKHIEKIVTEKPEAKITKIG